MKQEVWRHESPMDELITNHSFHSLFIFDELICVYRRANEKWKLAHFGFFLPWRLGAADVPLSKEFNAGICSAEAFKEVSGCTGQHPGSNVFNGVNVRKEGAESAHSLLK